jgi:fumarylacetoacetase
VARIGEFVLDLRQLESAGLLSTTRIPESVFSAPSLNRFMSLGPLVWRAVSDRLAEIQEAGAPDGSVHDLRAATDVTLTPVMPFEVADYCDFYASEDHASNIGKILRPGTDPLPGAWRHIPLGYHGRAGTVFASGTPVVRPLGVIDTPQGLIHAPTRRLDVEVELGYVVGVGSKPGRPVAVDEALDHLFGVVLLNDWSARDIQAFEYQPLGPFLGKSFATSVSLWVVPMWMLESYLTDGPEQGDEVPGHLNQPQPRAYDVSLELSLNGTPISRPQARNLHWSPSQLLAHLTSNGASLRTGDLLATGTISGPEPQDRGSLMEIAWGGRDPIDVGNGRRTWLEDGDTVSIRGWCGSHHDLMLGEVEGTVTQ